MNIKSTLWMLYSSSLHVNRVTFELRSCWSQVHVVEILDFFIGDIRLSVYKRVLTSVTR